MTTDAALQAAGRTSAAPRPALPYFARAGDGAFDPTPAAVGSWSDDMASGPAVLGLLARTVETGYADDAFTPARLTADLFRPVRMHRVAVRSRVVRWGNRIRVVEAELVQDGETVSRGAVVYYRATANAPGEQWEGERAPEPPGEDAFPGARLIASAGDAGWFLLPTGERAWHSAQRKRLWAQNWSVVEGEAATPFLRAATLADLTNLVTSSGTGGVGYINGDVTLALSRLPSGTGVGLEAQAHHAAHGVAVGTATMFDRDGVVGQCTATCIANRPRKGSWISGS